MILNEFLKAHRRVEEQATKIEAQSNEAHKEQAEIAQLKTLVTRQERQIEALIGAVQKVSDKMELSKKASKIIVHCP